MFPIWLCDQVTPFLARAIRYTLLWGMEGIEARTLGGVADRVPFVNESQLRARLSGAELRLGAVVPGIFEVGVEDRIAWMNDIELLKETASFCRRHGCEVIVGSTFSRKDESDRQERIESAVEVLRRAGAIVGAKGLRLALLNESGKLASRGSELAELVSRTDHPAVGAAWSPAESLRHGEPAHEAPDALVGRTFLVRVRDGDRSTEGWFERPLGQGSVDWPGVLRRLSGAGFDGPVSLELPEAAGPSDGLAAGTALVHLIRAGDRAPRTMRRAKR